MTPSYIVIGCKSNKKNKNMQTFLCLIQFLFVNLQPQRGRGNLQTPLSQSFSKIKVCKASANIETKRIFYR
jgi:hypothetical protein